MWQLLGKVTEVWQLQGKAAEVWHLQGKATEVLQLIMVLLQLPGIDPHWRVGRGHASGHRTGIAIMWFSLPLCHWAVTAVGTLWLPLRDQLLCDLAVVLFVRACACIMEHIMMVSVWWPYVSRGFRWCMITIIDRHSHFYFFFYPFGSHR